MSFKSLNLKKAYSSDIDDILNDFYIPVLETSIEYHRLAGFFSSTSLAISARGITGLIKNGGVMKLIVSPRLSEHDLKIIVESNKEPEKYVAMKMVEELEKLEDEFVKDHLFALGWMLANNKLDIKVAIAYDNDGKPLDSEIIEQTGLFHQKVGILKDTDGNIITFSGSINESAMGWLSNIEEFKVFCNWEITEEDYIKADITKFDKFWSNQSPKVKVLDVPRAVEEKLVKMAPSNIDDINLNKWYTKKKGKIKLFAQQEEAIGLWIKNGMKGIFEMATGTGKTYTALGCLDKIAEDRKNILIIITCPYQHLAQQWKREIDKYGIDYDKIVIADSSNISWKNVLTGSLLDIHLGYKNKVIVLTTHRTFSSDDFVNIIKNNKNSIDIFLIADEVHGLGAEKSMEGLIEEYNLRLGLSATPKRWFDLTGTNVIYDYFGDVIFEFPLEKAINTINPITNETYLTPYRYIPKFVSLTSEELEDYFDKTKSIIKQLNTLKNEEKKKILENLIFQRANIIKNARGKYAVLENILDKLGSSIQWTIVYCSPQQINEVKKIISSRKITSHGFTMKETTTPEKKYYGLSQRDYLLQKFGEGKYQMLVAMKCLDEGVDVPPARTAILMASSGNPREYIQRIGRIIRRYPQKTEATIYDAIVTPSFEMIPPELKDIERHIFKKELKRCAEIASIATNNAEALKLIYDIKIE